jgi:hypothetical protein
MAEISQWKPVVRFQSSQGRCHDIYFSPDVCVWEEGRSQSQNFNYKCFYFYIEVIIIYFTVCKTRNISFKLRITSETVVRDDFN